MSGTKRKPGRPPGSKNKNTKSSAKGKSSGRNPSAKSTASRSANASRSARAAESKVNGRPNFSSNFLWDATLSLLTPITTAPFSVNCGYNSCNAGNLSYLFKGNGVVFSVPAECHLHNRTSFPCFALSYIAKTAFIVFSVLSIEIFLSFS